MPAQRAFDPTAVRDSLAPLGLAGGHPRALVGAPQAAYLAHYGLPPSGGGVEHALGTLDTAHHRIAVHHWRPATPRGTVVVVHGYFDHVGLYSHLIRFLLEHDFAVLAFDLPGHGLSSGPPATIDTFDRYTDALQTCLDALGPVAGPLHAIGQSTGGAVLMQWLMARGHSAATSPFAKLVLLAPLVRPYLWTVYQFVFLSVRHRIVARPRTFANNSDDPEFLRFLRDDDPLQARELPVQWVAAMVEWKRRFVRYPPCDIAPLVVQGRQDRTVDWRFNVRVIKRLFRPHVIYLPKARHHLVNESPALRAQVFAAVAEELA